MSSRDTTWNNDVKLGEGDGWAYDQIGITYNQILDPVTLLSVTYDSLGGNVTSWSNIDLL